MCSRLCWWRAGDVFVPEEATSTTAAAAVVVFGSYCFKIVFFTIENAITVKNINRHDDAVFTTHAQLAERFAADFEMLLFSCEDGVQWEELS